MLAKLGKQGEDGGIYFVPADDVNGSSNDESRWVKVDDDKRDRYGRVIGHSAARQGGGMCGQGRKIFAAQTYSMEFTGIIFPPSILKTFHVIPRCDVGTFHEPLRALST